MFICTEGLFWGAQGLLCLAQGKRFHCCFMLVRACMCVGHPGEGDMKQAGDRLARRLMVAS